MTMLRAYDFMTRAVASVTPDTPIRQVAQTMRNLNIGDVLVVQDGQLKGIVTDRDLTLQVLTNGANPQSPVEPYMTTNVITGEPHWTMEQVADVMGKHQIRRLPIVQDGTVVGIVSLGDVALHTRKRETVAESLRNISEATRTQLRASRGLRLLGLVVPVAAVIGTVWFVRTKPGQRALAQLTSGELPDKAVAAFNDILHALQDPKTRRQALEALEATGIPEKARHAAADGARLIQDPKTLQHARKTAEHLAHEARRQTRDLPEHIWQLVERPKPKRFWIV